jgi:hypothetical protein
VAIPSGLVEYAAAVTDFGRRAERDDRTRRLGAIVSLRETIELGDWVRPVLLEGAAVLLLESPNQRPDGSRVWRTAPRAVVKQH